MSLPADGCAVFPALWSVAVTTASLDTCPSYRTRRRQASAKRKAAAICRYCRRQDRDSEAHPCVSDRSAAIVRMYLVGQLSSNQTGVGMGLLADRQSQLLIDGKLESGSGGTFPTVNPATEEVLGVAADATAEDMGRAIGAARRAFDDTDWSTDTELRVRCIRQLQQALRDNADELRELADRRGRCSPDADGDGAVRRAGRGSEFLRRYRGVVSVDDRSGHRRPDGHQDASHDRARGDRRRRRHHAVELPESDQPRQDRTCAGRR